MRPTKPAPSPRVAESANRTFIVGFSQLFNLSKCHDPDQIAGLVLEVGTERQRESRKIGIGRQVDVRKACSLFCFHTAPKQR